MTVEEESKGETLISAAIGYGAGFFLGYLGTAVLETVTPRLCPNCLHPLKNNKCPSCGTTYDEK